MGFRRYEKYLVLKIDDIIRSLHPNDGQELERLCGLVCEFRRLEGKKANRYIVVNEDEPYAEVVWKLIEIQENNPEGMKILLGNLDTELAGF